MSEFAVSKPHIFRPAFAAHPRTPSERYKRVHYYVATLGADSSALLKKALLAIRKAAEVMPDASLQAAARKQFTEAEFLPATKELLCLWIHFEAVDQGGLHSPAWLLHYLRLSLYAADYLLMSPQAMPVMDSHAHCQDMKSLHLSVSGSLARRLGFGMHARALAPALVPLLSTTRNVRQDALRKSLSLDLDQIVKM